MKTLILLFILAFLPSCIGGGSVLCEAGKAAASVVAVGISAELACSNIAAIKTSLEEKLEATNICESTETKALNKSAIGLVICAPLIEGVFAGGISQLPKDWGCTGGGSIAELKAKLIASCQNAI